MRKKNRNCSLQRKVQKKPPEEVFFIMKSCREEPSVFFRVTEKDDKDHKSGWPAGSIDRGVSHTVTGGLIERPFNLIISSAQESGNYCKFVLK
jgi:hypothetical protein